MARENINEALRVIKNMRSLIAQTKIDFTHVIEYRYAVEVVEAVLEKQIPKKPKEMSICSYSAYIDWVCPKCNQFHRSEYPLNYCSDCGQKIDWGEEE